MSFIGRKDGEPLNKEPRLPGYENIYWDDVVIYKKHFDRSKKRSSDPNEGDARWVTEILTVRDIVNLAVEVVKSGQDPLEFNPPANFETPDGMTTDEIDPAEQVDDGIPATMTPSEATQLGQSNAEETPQADQAQQESGQISEENQGSEYQAAEQAFSN